MKTSGDAFEEVTGRHRGLKEATASHTLKWCLSLSGKNFKSEFELTMSEKGFGSGEVGARPGARFLTEATRGLAHLLLPAS